MGGWHFHVDLQPIKWILYHAKITTEHPQADSEEYQLIKMFPVKTQTTPPCPTLKTYHMHETKAFSPIKYSIDVEIPSKRSLDVVVEQQINNKKKKI